MHKKTCLITGATSGLGKELAKNLSNLDYKLILIGKTKSKINNLQKILKNNKHEYYCLNLNNLNNIKKMLSKINLKKIDILINNAGGLYYENKTILTSEIIKLNYLSHVFITEKLLKKLYKSKIKKIVFISSHAHKRIKNKNDLLNKSTKYDFWTLYKISKHFLTTYTYFLKNNNNSLKIYVINPGRISSNFRLMGNKIISKFIYIYLILFGKRIEIVADRIIKLIANKKYSKNKNYYDIDKKSSTDNICLNKSFQNKLWELTKFKIRNIK